MSKRQLARQIGPDSDLSTTAIDSERRQWVHLFPWGESINLIDGRGPFAMTEAEANAVLANWALETDSLLIDYEHRSELTDDSTASGWLQAMVSVDASKTIDTGDGPSFADKVPDYPSDIEPGMWGLIQWTPTAAQRIADRELRKFSPVFIANGNGSVSKIKGGGITNVPAIQQLQAVASKQREREEDMSETKSDAWRAMATRLGIKANSEDEFNAAIDGMKTRADASDELTKQLATANAEREKAEAAAKAIEAKQLATTAIELAIEEGRVAPEAKDTMIALHVLSPEACMASVNAVPKGAFKATKDGPPDGRQGAKAGAKAGESTEAIDDGLVTINASYPGDMHFSQENLREANRVLAAAKGKLGEPGYARAVRKAVMARREG